MTEAVESWDQMSLEMAEEEVVRAAEEEVIALRRGIERTYRAIDDYEYEMDAQGLSDDVKDKELEPAFKLLDDLELKYEAAVKRAAILKATECERESSDVRDVLRMTNEFGTVRSSEYGRTPLSDEEVAFFDAVDTGKADLTLLSDLTMDELSDLIQANRNSDDVEAVRHAVSAAACDRSLCVNVSGGDEVNNRYGDERASHGAELYCEAVGNAAYAVDECVPDILSHDKSVADVNGGECVPRENEAL